MAQLSLFAGKRQRGKQPPAPKEYYLQKAVADTLNRWCTRGWRWTHLPFGESRGRGLDAIITGKKLKRMGTKSGWPDLILLSPHPAQVHFLELKRRGFVLSDAQQEFQWFCLCNGYPYAVADNLEDAIAKLKEWGAVRATVAV